MSVLGDPVALLAIFAALALGGLLKGVIGMGAPVVAVPIMSVFFDVRLAVVIMVVPNLVTNTWQVWHFRRAILPGYFMPVITVASAAGAFVGTVFLVRFPADVLAIAVAAAVVAYVGLRLASPEFVLATSKARALSFPAGLLAGLLQGAAGISAPVSVSFLNAMRLKRATFIASISAMFVAMSLVQIPTLLAFGLLNQKTLAAGFLCLVPLFVFMRIGSKLSRHITPQTFDRATMVVLVALAARLVWPTIW